MITVEKIGQGTYFEDAFKLSFKYDPVTVGKVKELAQRRYLPEEKAWEIPAYELPNLVNKVGINNIKSDDAVLGALKTKEIEDRREATQERLRNIKPSIPFDFTTAPLPHQIEAFNYGLERNALLIGDEQGLGKTKESIDIVVARKRELCKCLIVCGVNSVKYNWEAEIRTHSKEKSVMIDDRTMDQRVQSLNSWLKGAEYFAIINIESLRNEDMQDAIYAGVKEGFIGPIIAEDLWNILTWLGVEKRSFYSFRNTYCIMGGYGGYKVVGHKNLESLNAELNKVMIRRKKEEVLDLPPKVYHTEFVELTRKQQILYRDIKQGIVEQLEDILQSVNPLSCTLRLRQLTGGLFTEDNPKLDRIKDMLEEEIIPNGNKAIIFSQWESITSVYLEALRAYNPIYITGKGTPGAPGRTLAIGTIGAMGTGLTLNKASYVFFVDKLWNSGENAQAEDRAHRIGTAGTVNVISMVAKGSVDEGVEEYLLENKELFDRVVDGKGSKADVRSILNKLLKI